MGNSPGPSAGVCVGAGVGVGVGVPPGKGVAVGNLSIVGVGVAAGGATGTGVGVGTRAGRLRHQKVMGDGAAACVAVGIGVGINVDSVYGTAGVGVEVRFGTGVFVDAALVVGTAPSGSGALAGCCGVWSSVGVVTCGVLAGVVGDTVSPWQAWSPRVTARHRMIVNNALRAAGVCRTLVDGSPFTLSVSPTGLLIVALHRVLDPWCFLTSARKDVPISAAPSSVITTVGRTKDLPGDAHNRRTATTETEADADDSTLATAAIPHPLGPSPQPAPTRSAAGSSGKRPIESSKEAQRPQRQSARRRW